MCQTKKIVFLILLFGHEAMLMSAVRAKQAKSHSLLELIQGKLDKEEMSNRETKLAQDVTQLLLQNNKIVKRCSNWWCGDDRATDMPTVAPPLTTLPSSHSSSSGSLTLDQLLAHIRQWLVSSGWFG